MNTATTEARPDEATGTEPLVVRYTTSKVVMSIICGVLCIAMAAFLTEISWHHQPREKLTTGVPFILSFLLPGLYLLRYGTSRDALWLYPDGRFDHHSWFGRRRRAHVRDFKGFWHSWYQGTLISGLILDRTSGKRSVTVAIMTLDDPATAYDWFAQRLASLDRVNLEQQQAALSAQQTSEQPDLRLAIDHINRWEKRVLLWPLIGAVATGVTPRSSPYREALSSLFACVNLAMLTLVIADMARHRSLVIFASDRVQLRVHARQFIWPFLAIFAQGAFYLPINHFPRELALGLALVIAVALAWLPGAPEVTLLHRAVAGLTVLFLSLPLLFTLNVALAPMPVHEIHTATVTDLEPGKKQNQVTVTWAYDEPVGGYPIGWQTQTERSVSIGDRLAVDVARGGLGWYWLVKTTRLPDAKP